VVNALSAVNNFKTKHQHYFNSLCELSVSHYKPQINPMYQNRKTLTEIAEL